MQQYVGQWWTPSVPDETLIGTLTFGGGDGPNLELASDVDKKLLRIRKVHPVSVRYLSCSCPHWMGRASGHAPTRDLFAHL